MPSLSERLAEKAKLERDRTANVPATPPVSPTPDVPATDGVATPARTAPPIQAVPRTPDVPATPRVLVDDKDGHLEVPHWMSDNLFPQLEPFEQVLYYRLYRLSHGFGRDECLVGTPALERATKIKHTALFTTIKKLEARGLIERLGQVVLGARGGQGNRYRVNLPAIVPSTSAVPPTRNARRTRDVPRTPGVPMKERKETHETAAGGAAPSVYDVRTVAARLLEAHRTDPGFDLARLRALVRDALIGQGVALDEALVEEATRGMA
jgi:hypothetical protein